MPTWASSQAISDLTIVLEADGRSYTAQHTIASEGPLLTLNIPPTAAVLGVQFMGPEKLTFAHAQRLNTSQLSIWSGSALVRYRDSLTTELSVVEKKNEDDLLEVTFASLPDLATGDNALSIDSTITWVFPPSIKIIGFETPSGATANWLASDQTVVFTRKGNDAVNLSIQYQPEIVNEPEIDGTECDELSATSDLCAPDNDEDGVPDYRDICLNVDVQLDTVAAQGSRKESTTLFGCASDESMVLEDVVFTSGQSYLDVSARMLLDRVANALQLHDNQYYEIGAHTDDDGGAKRNYQLSLQRAEAVRYYLMLRGVGPNQIRAAGYGESRPFADNSTLAGRLANRRIEMKLIR